MELTTAGAKLDEMDQVQHLLLTLPPVYDGLITALETLNETNLNMAFVKTKLLDYETKITILEPKALLSEEMKPQMSRVMTNKRKYTHRNTQQKNYPNKGSFQYKSPYKYKKCNHCGKLNHIQRDCYHYQKMIEKQQGNKTRKFNSRPVTLKAVQEDKRET